MTRLGWIMMTCFAVLFVADDVDAAPVLSRSCIWNASASVPIGLYAVNPTGVLHVGDLVVVRPPEAARGLPRRARLSGAKACRS